MADPCTRCGTPARPQGGHGWTAAGYTCPPADETAALRARLAESDGLLRTALEMVAAVSGERDTLIAAVARAAEHTATMAHGEDCRASRHESCGEAYGRPDSWCCFGANATEHTTREECIEAQKDECNCGLEALRGMLTASGDPWPEVTP